MEQTIKYGDKTIDDRFVLGKLLIETNFRGYVVEKNETWGYSLFKVEHKSDINSDRLYLIVEDLTEVESKYERMLRILKKMKEHIDKVKTRYYGLCGLLMDLSDEGILRKADYDIMIEHLKHRFVIPDKHHITSYLWKRGEIEPRLKWINEEIKIFTKAIEE